MAVHRQQKRDMDAFSPLPVFHAAAFHSAKGCALQGGLVVVEAVYGCQEAMPPPCSRAAPVHADAAEAASPTVNGHGAAAAPGATSLVLKHPNQRKALQGV